VKNLTTAQKLGAAQAATETELPPTAPAQADGENLTDDARAPAPPAASSAEHVELTRLTNNGRSALELVYQDRPRLTVKVPAGGSATLPTAAWDTLRRQPHVQGRIDSRQLVCERV